MYVVKMFDQYWLRDMNDHVDEIHDLEYATKFKTKKAAKEVINSTILEEYCTVVKYSDEIDQFLSWKDDGMVRREIPKINEKFSRPFDEKNDTIDDVINFYLFVSENEFQVKQEYYNTWPKLNYFLENFYSHCRYISPGYNEFYHTFNLMVKKDADFGVFKSELSKMLSYVTYEKEGYKVFDIFDHECAEYDYRYFYYNTTKDKHKIVGRYDDLFEGTLKECFDVIKRKYYYG